MIPAILSIAAPVAIVGAYTAFIAYKSATREARLIAEAMGGPALDHKPFVTWRIMRLAPMFWIFCVGYAQFIDVSWPSSMVLALLKVAAMALLITAVTAAFMAAVFAIVHRYTLNKKRGLNALYCSPTSWYDRLYLKCPYTHPEDRVLSKWIWRHPITYREVPNYHERVHRAGLIMYILELSCLITSALLYGTGVILSNTN